MKITDFIAILARAANYLFDVFKLCFSSFNFDIVTFLLSCYGVIFAAKTISNSHSSDFASTIISFTSSKGSGKGSKNRNSGKGSNHGSSGNSNSSSNSKSKSD